MDDSEVVGDQKNPTAQVSSNGGGGGTVADIKTILNRNCGVPCTPAVCLRVTFKVRCLRWWEG